jgi:hypothetical protein
MDEKRTIQTCPCSVAFVDERSGDSPLAEHSTVAYTKNHSTKSINCALPSARLLFDSRAS